LWRPQRAPFFRDDEGAVDEALADVDLAALGQVPRQRFEHGSESPVARPLLEAAVAGLVRREALWQVLPAGARAQYPEDAVHHLARVSPRPAPAVVAARRLGDERFDNRPLFIS
jgi:hypothetical protein